MSANPPAVDRAAAVRHIKAAGAVAVVRTDTPEQALGAARATIAGGLRVIEITLTVPNAPRVIAALVAEFGEAALVGAGTVMTASQAHEAAQAGAAFLVSPCVVPEVMQVAANRGIAMLPGAFTPTEIYSAFAAGGDIIKIFPAARFGPQYLRDLRGPLPQIPLLPTAGVTAANVHEWFGAGAVAVGAGGSVLDTEAIGRGDWPAVTTRVREFVAAVRAARHEQ